MTTHRDRAAGMRVQTPTGKYGTVLAERRMPCGKRPRISAVDVLLDPFCARFAGEAPPMPRMRGLVVTYRLCDLTILEVPHE